jgi:hypothetical protein
LRLVGTRKKQHIKAMADNQPQYETMSLKFETAQRPDFKAVRGLPFIKFGDKNDYPTYLNNLYKESAKHQSIINGKRTYIYGKGITSVNDLPLSNAFIQRYKDMLKKCIFDIRNCGGCYINIIPNRAGTAYTFYHIPFNRIRSNEYNSVFFYSNEWDKKRIPTYTTLHAFVKGVKQSSILAYREYNGNDGDPYPLPDWFAALNWIEADIEVSKHTLTNAKCGFSPRKMMTFYNGKPTNEMKANLTKDIKASVSGSGGDTTLIAFCEPNEKPPTIEDLGESSLSKEDFNQVNNLISENVYAGHGITTPQLFGVPQKEGLGGDGQKLKTGYDIFNNTYVTEKQQEMEQFFGFLASLNGIVDDFKFIQLDPLGLDISVKDVVNSLPKQFVFETLGVPKEMWELENIGVDNKPTGTIPIKPSNKVDTTITATQDVNSTLTNLTGRQRQNVMGIVRQFGSGKLTKAQASILLKNGYGLTDQDVKDFLGIDDDPLTNDSTQAFSEHVEDDVINVFSAFGDDRKTYSSIFAKTAMVESVQMFAEVDSVIESYVKLNPKATVNDVATVLNIPLETVIPIYEDAKISVGSIKRNLPKFEVKYTYEKRPDATGGELLATSRPFCVKMIGLDRYYSREDIQKISGILGYDVFNRAGGFWNNNGTIEYHCRHEFRSHVVIKKK